MGKLGRAILAPDNPGWNRQARRCGVSRDTGIDTLSAISSIKII